MAFLDFLLAEALAAGLERAAAEERHQPPPQNFFVLPQEPLAWVKFHEACRKENMVIAVEITDNSKANCRRVQHLFVREARKFESIPFVRVEIEYGLTYKQLRDDLGGVDYTPTILIVFFGSDGVQIGKVEGDVKIEGAIRTGDMERLLRSYIQQRQRLKTVEHLAEQFAASGMREREDVKMKQEYDEDVKQEIEQSEMREREMRRKLAEEREKAEEEKRKREEEIKKTRPENVRKLLDLDLSAAGAKHLKEIMKGMGISTVGIFEKPDLRRQLVQSVPELRLDLQSRLEKLKKDKEVYEQELNDAKKRLEETQDAISLIERDLKPL